MDAHFAHHRTVKMPGKRPLPTPDSELTRSSLGKREAQVGDIASARWSTLFVMQWSICDNGRVGRELCEYKGVQVRFERARRILRVVVRVKQKQERER
jgi:hypothetical protein